MPMTAEPVDPIGRPPAVGPARVLNLAPRRSADVRQAQLFIQLLEAEMVDLQSQLAAAEARADPARPGVERHVGAVRNRIKEVRRLLDALSFRFPAA